VGRGWCTEAWNEKLVSKAYQLQNNIIKIKKLNSKQENLKPEKPVWQILVKYSISTTAITYPLTTTFYVMLKY